MDTVQQQAQEAAELYRAGVAAFRRGDDSETRRLSQAALDIGRRINDPASIARGLIGLARVAFRAADHAALRALCEEAEPYWLQLANPTEVTSPIHLLAESSRMQGQFERARGLYERSIEIGRRAGNDGWVAMELNNMAFLELQAGNPAAAEQLARQSLAAHAPGRNQIAWALLALGGADAARGDGVGAARKLAASHRILADQKIVYDPAEQPLFDRAVAEARRTAGSEAFERAWAEGAALGLEDAGRLASGELHPPGQSPSA